MSSWIEPFSVKGDHVSVVPLTKEHRPDLEEAAGDGSLHQLWFTSVPEPQGVEREIERRMELMEQGSMLPFAVIQNSSRKAVGMTTYMNIDEANKRLEIGSTWYRKSVQRTPLNTECKYILLKYAFESLNCIAVEFRTHYLNHRSRRAIERLGAKLDGILRSHLILPNKTIRDTAVYSIIASEWPTVEANLKFHLARPRSPS